MSVFDDPKRVALWVNNPGNLGRLPEIATVADASFSDVFLPRSATVADCQRVRAQKRPDGTTLICQLSEIAFTSASVEQPHVKAALAHDETVPHKVDLEAPELTGSFVSQVLGDIARLYPQIGTVDLDTEVPDNVLAQFMRDTVAGIRAQRPNFKIRLDIAPGKAGFLPVDLLKSDPNLFAGIQCYYGDMSRISEQQLWLELLTAGVPAAKASLCYGAATQAKVRQPDGSAPWQRVSNVPSVYYQGTAFCKIPGPSMVFSDDLLADVGLLP